MTPMKHEDMVNILLVDDRPDGLLALEVALRSPEYRFVTKASGEEALRWLLENNEDLAVILMDVQMPHMDGFETAALIKLQERYAHVPIIFVTGIYGDPRFVTQGYKVGAIDYVTKPYQPYILQSKVAVLVDLHKKNRLITRMHEEAHERSLLETKRRLEEEFSLRERRLIALVENSTDFIAVTDRSFKLEYLNQAGRALVGIGGEKEACAHQLPDLFAAKDRARLLGEILPKAIESGGWEEELCMRHERTGNVIPVWSRGFLIRSPKDNSIDGIATVTRDLTRHKASQRALRESEQRFRTLTSAAPVGIFSTDAQGGCRFVNVRWQELSGMAQETAVSLGGFGWLAAIHPDDKDEFVRHWQDAIVSGAEFQGQCRLSVPDGRVRWVQMKAVALHDDIGTVTGYIGSCVDVTESVKSEETLRNAAEALTRSNTELQRFAWIASHDLKEPLRMVSNYVKLLERRYKGKLGTDADEYIKFAVEGSHRMYALVEGILKFSGVDRCAQPPRLIDCNEIFDSALASLKLAVEENGALVTRSELPCLLADPVQIGQLFQNLISNAVKFHGPEAPRIDVTAEPEDDHWHIRIADNGIGIEPQFRDRIFGVFQRLHTQDQYPGTGVGLAICKKIVEKHGGRIWVESEGASGSTFVITMPRSPHDDRVPKQPLPSSLEYREVAGHA